MICPMIPYTDETEDEDVNEEYIEEINRDIVMIAAAKLVASDTVPKVNNLILKKKKKLISLLPICIFRAVLAN